MSFKSHRDMPDVMREEEESWLFDEFKTLETSSSPISTTMNLSRPLRLYLFALHTTVLILVFAFFAVITRENCPNIVKKQSWSPVQQSVDYELQAEYVNDLTSSTYSGPPLVEQDRAWDKLIRPTFFRTTKEELERAGESFENIAECLKADTSLLWAYFMSYIACDRSGSISPKSGTIPISRRDKTSICIII